MRRREIDGGVLSRKAFEIFMLIKGKERSPIGLKLLRIIIDNPHAFSLSYGIRSENPFFTHSFQLVDSHATTCARSEAF